MFTDLDDTLLQTPAKVRRQPHQLRVGALSVAAVDRDGEPSSFSTCPQRTLLALLRAAGALLVPVTGRNTDALARVNIPFTSLAATSHGALVLDANQRPCAHWLAAIDAEVAQWSAPLNAAADAVNKHITKAGLDARCRVIIDQDVPAYVSVKGTAEALGHLAACFAESTLGLHRNGDNVALLPPYASKRRAVEHIGAQLQVADQDLVLGLGDSLTDLPFLRACDFGLIPIGCQVDRALAEHCA